jgi:hypothetical protein
LNARTATSFRPQSNLIQREYGYNETMARHFIDLCGKQHRFILS